MSARCLLCARACPVRFTKGVYAIHRCAACDLEFVWPTPPPEAVEAVYADGYFSGDGHGYRDYFGRERAQATRKSTVRLDALDALGCRGGRLLGVGCAAGFFVEDARARGYEAFGVEPSPEAQRAWSEAARPWLMGDLDAARAHGPFDVITAWDVLEHLPDPLATLRALRAMAKPDAVFAVVVPVIGNVNTRLAPATWDQYKPPEHLWFFSCASMRALLRAGAGATVLREDVAWSRDARWVDLEGTSRAPLTRALRAIDGAAHRLARAVAPSLTVDSVAFYAKANDER